MSKKGVDSRAFMNQSTIVSAKFDSQCTYIGESAFKDCISLSEINNNNVIETIGSNAFAGTNISSADFNVLNILHADAFNGCSNLNTINIPNCSIIGEGAFKDCINLDSIKYGDVGTAVSSFAFNGCSKLKDISFDNFTSIENNAFENCVSLEKANFNQCSSIGSSAFYGCSNINQITISKCSRIGLYAFANCPNLEKVYIKNTSNIFCSLDGSYVFCTHNNSSFSINSNIIFYFDANVYGSYINDNYWKHYSSYMISIVEANQLIYKSNNNKSIETINESIRNNEYVGELYGLITFDSRVEELEPIFKYPERLISIDIPSKCEKICENAFSNCTKLKTITLSNTLTEIGNYAFNNCESLTSFTIPDTIIKLGEGIFAGCKNIKKFEGNQKYIRNNKKILVDSNKLLCVLPTDDSETEGRYYKISEIDKNITRLGNSCFYGCEKLRRVDIPSNVTEIGNYAFDGCENLREVHFSGNNPPTLGEKAFGDNIRTDFKIFVPEESLNAYCKSWVEYVNYLYPMPADNSIIYYSAEDIKLDLITPEKVEDSENGISYYRISNVTGIPINYFEDTTVQKVILGKGIKTLGMGAFKNCGELEYIYLSDNITSLGNQCFYGCINLTNIHIPKYSKSTFGDNIFYGCNSLKEFGTYYKGYVSDDNRCYIDNGTLMFFAKGDLDNNEKSYRIPDNITEINRSAFRGTTDITEITLNPSVKKIGNNAFNGCTSLISINDWDSVDTISDGAFSGCENLGKISLPNNLVTIGSNAFYNCVNMYMNTNIHNKIKSIGSYAFYNCKKFKYCNDDGIKQTLNLGNITIINSYAFYKCSELEHITLNNDIKTISNSAFEQCTNLKEVYISESSSLLSIGNQSFDGCKSLKNLNIPSKLTNIGINAFRNCISYDKKIILPGTVNTLGHGCFYKSAITEFEIPDYSKLISIPAEAFYECKNLEKINISTSRNLKTIEDNAFYGCKNLCNNMTNRGRLCLPNSITTIKDYAFYNCEGIAKVTLPTSLNKIGNNCFNGVINIHIPLYLSTCPTFSGGDSSKPFDNNCRIYIHNNLYDKYKTNTSWSKYINIMYPDNYVDITIDLNYAYIDKEFLGEIFKISNIGSLNPLRSIYLYNSVWESYMQIPYTFEIINNYKIRFSVNKMDMNDFLNVRTYYHNQTNNLNVSIPMLGNNNSSTNFRILVTLSDFGDYLGLDKFEFFPEDSVMLSMNANITNGEDWDNCARFYHNLSLPQNPSQFYFYLMGDDGKYGKVETPNDITITVPGILEHKVCPSIMYAFPHETNSNNSKFTVHSKISQNWFNIESSSLMFKQRFSLLGYFKNKLATNANSEVFREVLLSMGMGETQNQNLNMGGIDISLSQ